METIHVWRGASETDPYGNDVQGDPVPVGTHSALVAPNHPGEPAQVGRTTVITGYTLYITGTDAFDILAADLIEVRSPVPPTAPITQRRAHLLPVDGLPASWRRRDGSCRGAQLAVKGVNG